MVERGGPNTQAGFHYQNSVAALCLGDLLLWDVVDPAERVSNGHLLLCVRSLFHLCGLLGAEVANILLQTNERRTIRSQ